MDKQQRAQKKLQKKKEKARAKRYKKINNGLDICLIAASFLAFLTAAVYQAWQEKRNNSNR